MERHTKTSTLLEEIETSRNYHDTDSRKKYAITTEPHKRLSHAIKIMEIIILRRMKEEGCG